MVAKHWREFFQDFDARYEGWVTAHESGEPALIKSAENALPGMTERAWAELVALDREESDPLFRAVRRRAIVLGYERDAYERERRRKQKAAQQRREERTIRISRTVELPTECARCGTKLANPKTTGRPRVYCSPACRKAAYDDRRSGNKDAAKVQVVERVVTEVREHRVDVTHPRKDCIDAVFADEKALVDVIWTLIDRVRDPEEPIFTPDNYRFWDLANDAEALHEAVIRRTRDWTPSSDHPATRAERNMRRFTRKPPPEQKAGGGHGSRPPPEP